MRMFEEGIFDEWGFVIEDGAHLVESFYKELEKEIELEVQALSGVKSGYITVSNMFFLNKRKMHYMKYGPYYSLTFAEPFGKNLKITWYFYFGWAGKNDNANGFAIVISNFLGMFTGRTRDREIAFATIGKGCAETATKAVLMGAGLEGQEKEKSGQFGKLL